MGKSLIHNAVHSYSVYTTCVCFDVFLFFCLFSFNYNSYHYSQIPASDFSHALLINNAGTLGDVTKYTKEHSDLNALNTYWSTNMTSPLFLM